MSDYSGGEKISIDGQLATGGLQAQTVGSVSADALESFVELLAQVDVYSGSSEFYSRLCEATCRLAQMDRALIFRWDDRDGQIHAAGSYGIDLELFADTNFTVESAPIAYRALTEGRVIEVSEEADRQLPDTYRHLLRDATLVCTPISTAERWSGVILSDRVPRRPLQDDERDLLWMLGKSAALATFARLATEQQSKARQLEERIDLTREIHEGVVQRLFGLLLVFSSGADIDNETRERCAEELQTALEELKRALRRPLRRSPRRRSDPWGDDIDHLRRTHPEIGLRLAEESLPPLTMPNRYNSLAHSIFTEAVRNACKHAKPSYVEVSVTKSGDTISLEIVNDGIVEAKSGESIEAGVGLKLAAIEAIQVGGIVDFGMIGGACWRVRLTVPNDND